MIETSHAALLREVDAFAVAGNPAAAIQRLKDALASHPRFYAGWIRLGSLLYAEKAYPEAINAVLAAEQCDPLEAEFHAVQQSIQKRDFAQAEAIARHMLEQEPGHPRAVFTLAHLAQTKGDDDGRISILEAGLEHSPANNFLRRFLVAAQEESGAYGAALETARHIADVDPSFESLWALASILFRFGQNMEALETCDRAQCFCISDPARQSEVDLVRGQIYRIVGQREKCVASLRAAIAGNALNAAAWWGLADMKTYRFSPADRTALHALVNQPAASPNQKSLAAFALAKAFEGAGDWDNAMQLYRAANDLWSGARFDPAQFAKAVDRLTGQFGPAALSAQANAQPESVQPIFIVGLPRSGSTLLEQILASHSQIEGTYELPVLPSIKRKAHRLCIDRSGGDYLANVGRLSPEALSALGQRYLSEGAIFRSGKFRFFTDKMPFNFEHVGLIHKILPNAVIIDVRRNPLDCAFSLYKQYFTQGSSFSYSLSGLGHYYNGYLKLMDHWDRVLPGKVLRVQYEELVAAPEAQIRTLLDHVGLPFEEACLDFHRTDRPIRTASSEQVRMPMYTDSIGAWRHVSPHLDALKTALGPQTLARFERYLGAV